MSSARVLDPIPVAGTTANLTASGTITRPIRTVSSPSPSSSRRLLVRGVSVLAERGVRSDEVLDEGEGDEVEEIADMIDCDTSAKRTDARFWLLESVSAPWPPLNFFPTLPIHDDTGPPTLGPIASEPRPGTEDAGGNPVATDVRRKCFTSLVLVVGTGLGNDNDEAEDKFVVNAACLNAEGGGFEIWREDNVVCNPAG